MGFNDTGSFIKPLLDDFKAFCRFVDLEKPLLTKKKAVLGKKDAFNLNSGLHYKRELSAPNYQQDQYFCVDMLFMLAVVGQLYRKAEDDSGIIRLIRTGRMDSFVRLNAYEQYLFLLETYWCFQIFSDKYKGMMRASAENIILELLRGISLSEAGESVQIKGPGKDAFFDLFYSYFSENVFQLSFFGFCTYELREGVESKYEGIIKVIIPTPLGVTIGGILVKEGLAYLKNPCLPYYGKLSEGKAKQAVPKEGLHKILAKPFPAGMVENTVEADLEKQEKGIYLFKVSLSKKLWRTIRLSHRHTLSHLHLTIQEAFDFDSDHLYAFYFEGNKRTGKGIYCAECEEEGPCAEETVIGEIGLYPGEKIVYLFDFGDMWQFDVKLLGIDREGNVLLKPEIAETMGDSPEQYPSYDE